MNRDSYLNFLKTFKISDDKFVEYGLKDIIFIPKDKANIEWEILKKKFILTKKYISEAWVEMLPVQNICLKYTKVSLVIQI